MLPLHLDIFLVLLALSFASLLAHLLPLPLPLSVAVAEGLIWLTALRHAFNVMEAISQGLLTAEQRQMSMVQPERKNLPWKLLAIMIAWGILTGLVAQISPTLGQAVSLFFSVCLPASIMALSVSNSFFQGANPGAWIWIIRQVGKPYLALCFFLLLLSGGGAIALPLLAPLLGTWLTLPLLNFVFLYFNLIIFGMMGYVLYQYHQELGLNIVVPAAKNASGGRGGPPADPIGDQVAARIADGDLQGALDVAYEQQRLEIDNIPAQERYHRLLLLAEKKDRAINHGQRYLSSLLHLGHEQAAVELFRRLQELDPEFFPEASGNALPLAEAAFRARQAKMVIGLVRRLEEKVPRHEDIPVARFLLARTMSELLRKDSLAIDTLERLSKRFPDHEIITEAQTYLRVLLHSQPATVTNKPAAPG